MTSRARAGRGRFFLFLVVGLCLGPMSVGAADAWPNCTFKCTAGDVSLVAIYVVLPGGTCEPGGSSTAQVYGRFTASAKRYAVILMGDLHVEGGATTHLNSCAGDLSAGTTDVLLTTITWPCGSGISLGNIIVSWSTNQETCADAKCASRAAQCAKGEDVAVTTPLVVDFSSNAPQCLGTPMAFTNTTTGGTAPYTYSWDFGDGGMSTQASPSRTYGMPGTYTVTLTVRDRSSSSSSHFRSVTVSAIPAATAANAGPYCAGATISLVSSGGTSYSWTGPSGFASSLQNPTVSSASAAKAGTYTVTVRNSAGCSAQASTTVVVDSTPPTLTAPASTTVACGRSTDPAATGQATATDDSGRSPSVSYSDVTHLASCGGTGTITRTWTATDSCGNSTAVLQTITIVDATAPSLTLPADAAVECGHSTLPAATGQATATDSCSTPTVTYSDRGSLSGCSGSGTIQRTWTATDACGNATSGTQTIAVVDSTSPTLTLLRDVTVGCHDSTSPAATGQATATDTCSTPTVTYADRTSLSGCSGSGTIVRTWTAADACGNATAGTQTITVVDTTNPTLTVPRDVTVGCHDSTTPAATGQATATDDCSSPIVTYVDRASLSGCSGSGTIVRTWTATDACGNSASGVQTITVADTADPTLTVPHDITVGCHDSTSPGATGQATATDECSTPAVSYTDAAHLTGCSGSGTIVRTWKATDACGNVASGVQTITIADNDPPALTVPGGVTVQVGQSILPVATGQASAIDECSVAVVSYADVDQLSGDGTGAITRAWTTTDACGNATSGIQVITVKSAPPPPHLTLTLPADVQVDTGESTAPTSTGQPTISDTCATPATVTYVDAASLTGCDGTGMILRSWRATDACGSVASGVQTITVVDTGHIVLTVPVDVSVDAGESIGPAGTGWASASDLDAPDEPPAVTYSDLSNLSGCDGTGTILRTWTATDGCGNKTSAVQTITVADTGHMILTVPADITIEAAESNDPSVTGWASASDPDAPGEPPVLTYSDVVSLSGCDETGTILRTWTATDGCGNKTSAVQTITVVDSGHILLNVPADVVVDAGEPTGPTATGWASASDPDAPDESPAVTYRDVANLSGCDGTGTILRTWTATDGCGNVTRAVQTITVVDTGNMILTAPADVTIEAAESNDPSVAGWASASDPDAPDEAPTVRYADAANLTGCDGTGTIQRTWAATDGCGNEISAVQTITVVDTGHLSLIVPADVAVECGSPTSPAALGRATASDPDAGDEAPAVTYSDLVQHSGCGGAGIVTRTWTATDGCGNTISAVQTITVVDSTPPALKIPADALVEYGNSTDPAATGRASAMDSCSTTTVSHSDVSAPGSCAGRMTLLRTWTATDECGNAISGVQSLTVVDTTPPALTLPANATVECGDSTSPAATGNATASDASQTQVVTYADDVSRTGCGNSATIARTWTAADACGNASSAVQTITVVDSTAPSLTTPADVTVQVGQSTLSVDLGEASAVDKCSAPVVTHSDVPALNPDGTGTIVRTWTAADACGNAVQGLQTITLTSAPVPPRLTLVAPTDRTIDAGNATDPSVTGRAVAATTCSGGTTVTYEDQADLGGCDGSGTIRRTWTAEDTCGNQTSAVQQISVVDAGHIELTVPPDVTVGCNDSLNPSLTGAASALDPDATGEPPVVTYADAANLDACTGAGTVLRTWTATDTCGNSVSVVQTITVSGSCAPRVIISEVAWAGTGASSDEQWIELRNLGDTAVDLKGWTLRWRAAQHEVAGDEVWKTLSLAGTIAAAASDTPLLFGPNPQDPQTWWVDLSGRRARGDFYLIERISDQTVLDVPAGLVYDNLPDGERTLAISERGDVLELVGPGGCVIDTANAARAGIGGWTAGDLATKGTMERTDPKGGDVASNWHTNLGIITSGEDAGGVGLLATAGLENEPQLAQMVAVAAENAVPIGGGASVTIPLPGQVAGRGDNSARVVAMSSGTGTPVSLPLGVTPSGDSVTIQASGPLPSGQHAVWVRIGEVALLVLVQGP